MSPLEDLLDSHATLIFYASIAWWSVEEALRLLGNPPKSRPSWNLFSSFEEAEAAYAGEKLSGR